MPLYLTSLCKYLYLPDTCQAVYRITVISDHLNIIVNNKSNFLAKLLSCLFAFPFSQIQGFNENLHAIFCLAENAVSPDALRPDDIISLYSGRSVHLRLVSL